MMPVAVVEQRRSFDAIVRVAGEEAGMVVQVGDDLVVGHAGNVAPDKTGTLVSLGAEKAVHGRVHPQLHPEIISEHVQHAYMAASAIESDGGVGIAGNGPAHALSKASEIETAE